MPPRTVARTVPARVSTTTCIGGDYPTLCQGCEERGVPCQDPVPGGAVGLERTDVVLEGPAEHDAIGAREHVEVGWKREVVDLWLWLQDRQLALDRIQLRVAEQRRGSE